MYIHLGHNQNQIQSIELDEVNHHKALPYLSKLINHHKFDHDFNHINKIHVANSKLNDADYDALMSIFHDCDRLDNIELDSNHIDANHSFQLFTELAQKPLTSICFTDNWLGANTSKDFFQFLNQQDHLERVDFSSNWLGDKGIHNLLQCLHNTIHQLNLSCNDFHMDGMVSIHHFLSGDNKLSTLDVSYNHLNEHSAYHLAGIIRESTSLTCINANSNELRDQGILLIADAIKSHCKLTTLNVADNNISSDGAKILIDSACASGKIKHLDLRFNGLNKDEFSSLPKSMDVLI